MVLSKVYTRSQEEVTAKRLLDGAKHPGRVETYSIYYSNVSAHICYLAIGAFSSTCRRVLDMDSSRQEALSEEPKGENNIPETERQLFSRFGTTKRKRQRERGRARARETFLDPQNSLTYLQLVRVGFTSSLLYFSNRNARRIHSDARRITNRAWFS